MSFIKDLLNPILLSNGISTISLEETILPGDIITRKIDAIISKASMAIVDLSGSNVSNMWEVENIVGKKKLFILISDEDQLDGLPSDLRGMPFFKYSLYGDNKNFIDSLTRFLQENGMSRKNELNSENDYWNLFEKGEYNAAVIAAFRFLEITLSKECDLGNTSLMEALNLLNTNNDEDKEMLYKVKRYRKIRNDIVHNNKNVEKKEAEDIISCIEKLCESIKGGNIIVL